MHSNPLLGTWRLLSWENRSVEDDEINYPLGRDAEGYITYHTDGYMFVAIMSSHRINIAGGDLLSGTPDEEAEAEETFLAYCGPYDFEGDKVIHHIKICSFPNWSGVDQERLVELGDNRVTLSTPPVLMQGKQRTGHLIWERVSTSEQ